MKIKLISLDNPSNNKGKQIYIIENQKAVPIIVISREKEANTWFVQNKITKECYTVEGEFWIENVY